MPITGTDEISLKILKAFKQGIKLKDIPSKYSVSMDQAKRLSRYYKMLEKSREHLDSQTFEKIQRIGLKVLYLSPLFKEDDWEGLTEILYLISEETKRKELPLLIKALHEKRKRVASFKQDAEKILNSLQQREEELQQLEESTNELLRKIKEETKFLRNYPKNIQNFLTKHLGVYEDKLVLAKRLDSNWQRSLKKKKILEYDELSYIWYVKDLDQLVEDYIKRTSRKKPYPTEWDYEKEKKRNHLYGVPSSPRYRLPTGLAEDLSSSLETVEERKKEIEEERNSIQKQMKKLRKTSPKSFIESIEATNALSTHDFKRHGELQDKALKWLYNKGYIVASEVTLPNGTRADVAGYNEAGHLVIIEVKVSKADFQQDDKWESYLEYCDEFYFLLNNDARPIYRTIGENIGLLLEMNNTLKVNKPHSLTHKAKERDKIIFSINKILCKKFVYGY